MLTRQPCPDAGIPVAFCALVLLARHIRRRDTAGQAVSAAMAAYDQGFRPTAFERFIGERQKSARARCLPPSGRLR
jgi:hypothetical protein